MPRLTDNMGNGLFATKDINVGEDVLKTNRPFVAVLDTPKLEDTCSGCFGKKQFFDGAKPPKACTGCKVVRYCDRVSSIYLSVLVQLYDRFQPFLKTKLFK